MADCHPTGKKRAYNLQFYFKTDSVNEISWEKLENLKKKLSWSYACTSSNFREPQIAIAGCPKINRSRGKLSTLKIDPESILKSIILRCRIPLISDRCQGDSGSTSWVSGWVATSRRRAQWSQVHKIHWAKPPHWRWASSWCPHQGACPHYSRAMFNGRWP